MVSRRDARRDPCLDLALHPAHGASGELHAPWKATFRLQLIDHRPTQSGYLADLFESQQAQRYVTRCWLQGHVRFPFGRADWRLPTLEQRWVDVECRENLRGRNACRGRRRAPRRRRIGFGRLVVARQTPRAIQFSTSERYHPNERPRNRTFLGNRPIRLRPTSNQLGLRVSLATSWAVRISLSGGHRSLTHRDRTTGRETGVRGCSFLGEMESACIGALSLAVWDCRDIGSGNAR